MTTELGPILLLSVSMDPWIHTRCACPPVQRVLSLADALRALSMCAPSAIVLDLDEAPARVVDAVYRLRDVAPITPMLLLTHNLTRLVINTAHQQRCEVLAKPHDDAGLAGFFARAERLQRLSHAQLEQGLELLASMHGLDGESVRLLARTVGLAQAAAEEPALTPEEQHRRLRALLLRLRLRTVNGLHVQLLRAAAQVRSGRADEPDDSLEAAQSA